MSQETPHVHLNWYDIPLNLFHSLMELGDTSHFFGF